jgi:hypothetical protein
MKIAAFIFLMILSFLTFQPLAGSVKHEAKKSCCMKMKGNCHKTKQSRNVPIKCDDGNCNPFMACALGNFYTLTKSFAEEPFISQWCGKITPRNDNRLVFRSSDCWHPPENI